MFLTSQLTLQQVNLHTEVELMDTLGILSGLLGKECHSIETDEAFLFF